MFGNPLYENGLVPASRYRRDATLIAENDRLLSIDKFIDLTIDEVYELMDELNRSGGIVKEKFLDELYDVLNTLFAFQRVNLQSFDLHRTSLAPSAGKSLEKDIESLKDMIEHMRSSFRRERVFTQVIRTLIGVAGSEPFSDPQLDKYAKTLAKVRNNYPPELFQASEVTSGGVVVYLNENEVRQKYDHLKKLTRWLRDQEKKTLNADIWAPYRAYLLDWRHSEDAFTQLREQYAKDHPAQEKDPHGQ